MLDPARVAVVCSADHIALHRELDRVSFSAEPRAGDKALPSAHEHVWGFKAADGKLFTLRRGRFSEAIWLDKRIRARELHPRLRLTPGARDSEVLTLRSIRNGVVQDLYYYCDVRSIKSVSPEPCYCCQGSVELVEKPFRGKPEE